MVSGYWYYESVVEDGVRYKLRRGTFNRFVMQVSPLSPATALRGCRIPRSQYGPECCRMAVSLNGIWIRSKREGWRTGVANALMPSRLSPVPVSANDCAKAWIAMQGVCFSFLHLPTAGRVLSRMAQLCCKVHGLAGKNWIYEHMKVSVMGARPCI